MILLVLGCLWGLFDLWLLLAVGAISGPVSLIAVLRSGVGLMLGPSVLVIGSMLLFRSTFRRAGATLVAAGSSILTGFAVWNTYLEMNRDPLVAPPVYPLYVILFIFVLVADVTSVSVVKRTFSSSVPKHPA